MKLQLKKAASGVTLHIFVLDSSAADGSGLTGLTWNTANLVCWFLRHGSNEAQLALASLATLTTAHTDGGFIEVDSTNMPGLYRLDLSDAVCATGVDSVSMMLHGATNMAPTPVEIQLVSYDPNDAQRLGLASLPNVNPNANGGLPIVDATGRTAADLEAIDGAATNGYNATLKLLMLDIQNNAGAAIRAMSTGGNGAGLHAAGNGAGAGIYGLGGNGGPGIHGFGGAGSGPGIKGQAQAGDDVGMELIGEGTGKDLDADEIGDILADTNAIKAVTDALPDAGALTTLQAAADAIQAVTDVIPDAGALTTLQAAADAIQAVTDVIPDAGALTTLQAAADAIQAVTDVIPDAGALTTLQAAADAIQAVTDVIPDAGALTTLQAAADAIQAVTDVIPDAGALTTLAALLGRNRRIDNIVRVGGKITSYRLRLYGNAADCNNEVAELLTINATGTYAAGLLTDEKEVEA